MMKIKKKNILGAMHPMTILSMTLVIIAIIIMRAKIKATPCKLWGLFLLKVDDLKQALLRIGNVFTFGRSPPPLFNTCQ